MIKKLVNSNETGLRKRRIIFNFNLMEEMVEMIHVAYPKLGIMFFGFVFAFAFSPPFLFLFLLVKANAVWGGSFFFNRWGGG